LNQISRQRVCSKTVFNISCGDEQAAILLVVTAIDYKKHKGSNYISAEFDRHNEAHQIKGEECWYKDISLSVSKLGLQ